jgi:hypothetical protein
MHSMRFQFSLATLLVCVAVLGVVVAICVGVKVHEPAVHSIIRTPGLTAEYATASPYDRPPTAIEVAYRLVVLGVPCVAATLVVLWTIHRLKSRRHTEPLSW